MKYSDCSPTAREKFAARRADEKKARNERHIERLRDALSRDPGNLLWIELLEEAEKRLDD
jgi:hypothetical protein